MNTTDPEHSPEQRRGIVRTVIVLLAIIAVFLAMFIHKLTSPRVLSHQELSANGTVVFDKPRIIKEFSLVDQTGDEFDLESLRGKWTVMFFGFTTCPDICPTTLAELSRWYKTLNDDIRDQTQVVLMTVDPARDTPEALRQYMTSFDERFTAVTGEFLTIRSLTDQLNVAFNKVPLGDDDYTVDHSGHLVLINPYGHYHGIVKPPLDKSRLKLTFQSIVSTFEG